MFANVGWGEMLLLVMVGLVVLGPERLPGAIQWTADAIRKARDYLSGATRELREELGPEFDEFRQPINELQKLRGMTPKAAITKHLLDGDDSWITGEFDGPSGGQERSDRGMGTVKPQSAPGPAAQGPTGGPAPFDSDAT
jgi:sec-independent protein translocase protein TatB